MKLRVITFAAGLIAQSIALATMLSGHPHALLIYLLGTCIAIPGMMTALPGTLTADRALALGLCTVFSFAFPVFGLCFAGIIGWATRSSTSAPDEAEPYVFGTELDLARDSTALPKSAQQSVVDLLHSTDRQARRNAVLSLKGVDPRLAIPILRKGIQDSDEQVRIYAQNIMAGILERHDHCIKESETRLALHGNDPLSMIHLAEQLHEAVFLGLVSDEEGRQAQLNKAIRLLEGALALTPHNSTGLLLLLKCYIRLGHPANAEKCCIQLQELGMHEEILLPWMLEIHFLDRRWEDLRTLLVTFRRARYANPKIESLAGFWLDTPKFAT